MASLLVPALLFVISLAVLLESSNVFVGAAEEVGIALGISPFVLGATVVAGGTSLPELVSGVFAVLQGAPTIVVGNVVGSNVANICLVLGLSAVVSGRITVGRDLERVDLPLLIGSATFLAIAAWDGHFEWYEGVLGLAGAVLYAHFAFSDRSRLDEVVEEIVEAHAEDPEKGADAPATPSAEVSASIDVRVVARFVGGLALVLLAADLLVSAVIDVSAALNVSAAFVALTAVSIGTSLPEIAVSVAAVRGGDADVAVGNVLGSNIVNTFAVIGVPSLIRPLTVPVGVLTYALPVMIATTLLYYFVTENREITRWEGGAVLLVYAVFLINLPQFV